VSAPGIIRPARRPSGWIAPGPRPLGTPGRPDVWPASGEDLCYLAGDWRILQRVRGHRWSLDDLVTAWFAASIAEPVAPARIADLGCGIGAVLMLLAWRFPQARCVGIEAQPVSAALARRSIALNGIEDRCAVRLGDLRDPAALSDGAVFNVVTGTPPYLPRGSATEPLREQQAPCHIELRGGIEDYCAAAARVLAPGARFVVCHAAGQRVRVLAAAQRAGLGVERRRDVIPRAGKGALFTVYAMRRTSELASCDVLPPLVVRAANGQRTDEFRTLRHQMGMPP